MSLTFLKPMTAAVTVVVLSACARNLAQPIEPPARPADARPAAQTTLEKVGLSADALNREVSPCTDFYEFACGGWLAKTPIPEDKAKWSRSFSEIAKRNEETLHDILEKARTSPAGDPALERLGAYYGACMDERTIEEAGLAPIQPLLDQARSVKDLETLALAFVKFHQNGIWPLFDTSSGQDFKAATEVIAYLDQNGLGLPDRDFYLREDEKSVGIRDAYRRYMKRMLVLSGESEEAAVAAVDAVMALETEIAKNSKTRVERRDPEGLYNRIDRSGVQKTVPSFPWDAYFQGLNLSGVETMAVTSVPFFEGMETLLGTVPPATWQAYLRWTALRSTAGMLPKAFVDESFAMAKVLTGQEKLEERWKRCISSTDTALGELLAQPYVEARFAGASKTATEGMIEEIRKAFARSLEGYDWMDDATRTLAEEKLQAVAFQIGYPERWRTYDFDVGPVHGANVLSGRRFETRRDLAKVGGPVDRSEWAMTPPTVNAYYSPLKNQMVFPAGILQPPFFDVDASIAVNMGGMGMVVGHELTHGFDDKGSQFAADGNLRNWWTPEVGEHFRERTQCIARQYAQYEAVPGVKLNGDLTLGENIADLGGVELAFAAYRAMRENAPERIVADGFSEDQQFFLAMGQAWCTNVRPEIARMYAQVDPHSPPKWRVNGSLQNVRAFADAFACEPGTPMRPKNVCEVW